MRNKKYTGKNQSTGVHTSKHHINKNKKNRN